MARGLGRTDASPLGVATSKNTFVPPSLVRYKCVTPFLVNAIICLLRDSEPHIRFCSGVCAPRQLVGVARPSMCDLRRTMRRRYFEDDLFPGSTSERLHGPTVNERTIVRGPLPERIRSTLKALQVVAVFTLTLIVRFGSTLKVIRHEPGTFSRDFVIHQNSPSSRPRPSSFTMRCHRILQQFSCRPSGTRIESIH